MDKCCGTCRFFVIEPAKSFSERLKERFKPIKDPYCRLSNKLMSKNDGRRCFVYKEVDADGILQRGIS